MSSRVGRIAIPLVLPLLLVAVWWFASAGSTSPFFPPLQSILASFRETWLSSRLGSDVLPSLRRMFAGYGLAVLVGIALGVLLGRVRSINVALAPSIQFSRALPAVALVPVSVTLLGIGDLPKLLLIAFVSLFPILMNTIDGVRAVDKQLEDVGRSFRLSRRQRVFAIQLPTAAPRIFAGMRVALQFAFIMMVVTELVAATEGIGFVTLNAQQSFRITEMWSGMILLGLLGAALNAAFLVLERRILRWHYRSTGR
jgi:ABC-type nitrate/sulfonate/bicarbonate transport system permease component